MKNLIALAAQFAHQNVAEIGVHVGTLSRAMLMTYPDIQNYYMIDPWQQYDRISQVQSPDGKLCHHRSDYWKKISLLAYRVAFEFRDKVLPIRMPALDGVLVLPDKHLDIAYIDSSHSYESVLRESLAYLSKVKDGGILCGDDYNWVSVARAVDPVFSPQMKTMKKAWFVQIMSEMRVEWESRLNSAIVECCSGVISPTTGLRIDERNAL